jgi:anti-anti-sigma factor
MSLNQRVVNGVIILDCPRHMTIGDGAFAAHVAVSVLPGDARILVDLKNLEVIDSAGIGEFLAMETIGLQGGRFGLLNPSENVREVLRDMGLYQYFEIFDDEAKAVQEFAQTGAAAQPIPEPPAP